MATVIFRFVPLAQDTSLMLAITVFCVVLWIKSPVEPWFTAPLGIGSTGAVFSPGLALTGSRSSAMRLVAVGILVGEASRQSGLARLVETLVRTRMPTAASTDAIAAFRYLLIAFCLANLALAVLVPSALVRVLILGSIPLSLGDLFTERRAKIGLFLGPLFATFYGSSDVLIGALANIIVTGLVKSTIGLSISWAERLFWAGPVMGIGRALVIITVTCLLYHSRDKGPLAVHEWTTNVGVTSQQLGMLTFLLVGVAIWMTDFLHGLHPLFGALMVALLAFAPKIGVVDSDAIFEADFSILLFFGTIFAIAAGLQQTGFTDLAAEALPSRLLSDASLPIVLVFVVVVSQFLALVMEGLAVTNILTPILTLFLNSIGISLVPVAVMKAVALNTYFFPYQPAVLVAILGMGAVDSVGLTRISSAIAAVSLLFLVLVQIGVFVVFFWRALVLFGVSDRLYVPQE